MEQDVHAHRVISRPNKGFTLVELMVTIAIVGILAAIAAPIYLNYISGTKQTAADNSLEQFGILLESYRAENGQFPPNNTYTYTEDGAGNVNSVTNPISGQFPDFKPRSPSASKTSFHYSVQVSNSGTATEQAIVTVTGVGDNAGYNATFTFR